MSNVMPTMVDLLPNSIVVDILLPTPDKEAKIVELLLNGHGLSYNTSVDLKNKILEILRK